jgi:hypothetical protein
MTDADLENLTVQDLRELRARVDDAIRAQIARSRPTPMMSAATLAAPAPSVIDLERERDAWQARRR